MEPINVSRENFPKSTAVAEGMQIINPVCDNYELSYDYDVEYINRKGKRLFLQIIKPINPGTKTPLIVFIPGSAFHRQNVKDRVAQLALLAVRGYTVALLEYRGSEDAAFPAFVLDAKAGILFMKQNASKYNIDEDKVFIMGDSSGAYTSLMAGLTWGVTELEDDVVLGKDYSVRGIIDYYGPTDISTMNNEPSSQDHRTADSPEGCMIGGYEVLKHPEIAEPTIIKKYIGRERAVPPVIMFHGSNDELVPFGQSCELYEALKAAGKTVSLYQIEGAHHGDRQFWSRTVLDMVENFIKDNI
ncbi:MAG: alpha/beta hydrolase fold domain-containing protein [Butyrivibrio sp.]